MARYTGPKHRLCRREGVRLCNSKKCPLDKKGAQPPGQHGRKFTGRISDYGKQLREKQKVKRMYGVLEKQFRKYYQEALKDEANTGFRLLQILESRLDNVVFRSNLAPSRRTARQIVNHGHVLVDGKKVSIPSYTVKPGSIVALTDKIIKSPAIAEVLDAKLSSPNWIKKKASVSKVEALPERDDIDQSINEQLIIEFYSR
jgi:small subunit ribosomal protein S4